MEQEMEFAANGTNAIYRCFIKKCTWPEVGVFKQDNICGKVRLENPIHPVWLAVVEFIKWLNQNKK